MKKVILMALLLVPMSIFAQKFGHFDSTHAGIYYGADRNPTAPGSV